MQSLFHVHVIDFARNDNAFVQQRQIKTLPLDWNSNQGSSRPYHVNTAGDSEPKPEAQTITLNG